MYKKILSIGLILTLLITVLTGCSILENVLSEEPKQEQTEPSEPIVESNEPIEETEPNIYELDVIPYAFFTKLHEEIQPPMVNFGKLTDSDVAWQDLKAQYYDKQALNNNTTRSAAIITISFLDENNNQVVTKIHCTSDVIQTESTAQGWSSIDIQDPELFDESAINLQQYLEYITDKKNNRSVVKNKNGWEYYNGSIASDDFVINLSNIIGVRGAKPMMDNNNFITTFADKQNIKCGDISLGTKIGDNATTTIIPKDYSSFIVVLQNAEIDPATNAYVNLLKDTNKTDLKVYIDYVLEYSNFEQVTQDLIAIPAEAELIFSNAEQLMPTNPDPEETEAEITIDHINTSLLNKADISVDELLQHFDLSNLDVSNYNSQSYTNISITGSFKQFGQNIGIAASVEYQGKGNHASSIAHMYGTTNSSLNFVIAGQQANRDIIKDEYDLYEDVDNNTVYYKYSQATPWYYNTLQTRSTGGLTIPFNLNQIDNENQQILTDGTKYYIIVTEDFELKKMDGGVFAILEETELTFVFDIENKSITLQISEAPTKISLQGIFSNALREDQEFNDMNATTSYKLVLTDINSVDKNTITIPREIISASVDASTNN